MRKYCIAMNCASDDGWLTGDDVTSVCVYVLGRGRQNSASACLVFKRFRYVSMDDCHVVLFV